MKMSDKLKNIRDRSKYCEIEGTDTFFLIKSRFIEDITVDVTKCLNAGYILTGSMFEYEGNLLQPMGSPVDFNSIYARINSGDLSN